MSHKPERHRSRRYGRTDRIGPREGGVTSWPDTRPGGPGMPRADDPHRPGAEFGTHPGANSSRPTCRPPS